MQNLYIACGFWDSWWLLLPLPPFLNKTIYSSRWECVINLIFYKLTIFRISYAFATVYASIPIIKHMTCMYIFLDKSKFIQCSYLTIPKMHLFTVHLYTVHLYIKLKHGNRVFWWSICVNHFRIQFLLYSCNDIYKCTNLNMYLKAFSFELNIP